MTLPDARSSRLDVKDEERKRDNRQTGESIRSKSLSPLANLDQYPEELFDLARQGRRVPARESAINKPRHSGLQLQWPVAESQSTVLPSTQSHVWLQPLPKRPLLQRSWQSAPLKPAAHVHVPAPCYTNTGTQHTHSWDNASERARARVQSAKCDRNCPCLCRKCRSLAKSARSVLRSTFSIRIGLTVLWIAGRIVKALALALAILAVGLAVARTVAQHPDPSWQNQSETRDDSVVCTYRREGVKGHLLRRRCEREGDASRF